MQTKKQNENNKKMDWTWSKKTLEVSSNLLKTEKKKFQKEEHFLFVCLLLV